jgi:hypothetical protein
MFFRIYQSLSRAVYMPSYCCESMLQPFIDRDIKIHFYSVIPDDSGIKYLIDYKKDFDIFFATSYFGYSSSVHGFKLLIF